MTRSTHAAMAGLLGCVLWSSQAHAASFDCEKARSLVEHAICSDNELSSLDDQLAVRYRMGLNGAKDKEAAKTEQKQWLALRNDCKEIECLKNVYTKRIDTLKQVMQAIPAGTEVIGNDQPSEPFTLAELRSDYFYNAFANNPVFEGEGHKADVLFRSGPDKTELTMFIHEVKVADLMRFVRFDTFDVLSGKRNVDEKGRISYDFTYRAIFTATQNFAVVYQWGNWHYDKVIRPEIIANADRNVNFAIFAQKGAVFEQTGREYLIAPPPEKAEGPLGQPRPPQGQEPPSWWKK